ncbi:MAG TPA: type IX secretion system membrane protein PorP/SprF, partial [Arenibacter sp.]|nr:type IX secretion system membrane protein PorP/SprF [Arenibacter sp.]
FGIGMVSDNLIDYNFSTNKSNSDADERTYAGMLDYRFPLSLFSWADDAYLLPMLYIRSVPYGDTQIGLNALLSTGKFWLQGGYNSFYGISGGLGGRFFKHLSLGALMEVGMDTELEGKDPSFELIAAYSFGKLGDTKKVVGSGEDRIEEEILKEKKIKKVKESGKKEKLVEPEVIVDKAPSKEKNKKRPKRKSKKALEEERRLEMELAAANRLKEKQEAEALAEAIRLEEKRRSDSIIAVELAFSQKIKADMKMIAARKKAGKPITKGHYEEERLEGEKAGFYLIANVYGTQKYRDIFIQTLQKKGINASSIFVPKKKYDYVYLERYDTLSEAEAAKDSKFGGKYTERIWIFRVLGD